MTIPWITICAVLAAIGASLVFSTLTYSLRNFSRAKLTDQLALRDASDWLEPTMGAAQDLIFVTAVLRLLANILILVGVLHITGRYGWSESARYAMAIGVAGAITLFSSVAIPHALAEHAAERIIALAVRPLHALHWALGPITRIMHAIDQTVAQAAGANSPTAVADAGQELQKEILSVVEEGEKEGVVDETEREMIESVIEFGDTTAAQAMTARPDIVGLPIDATMQQVKQILEESGHSRIPVYRETIDQIVGVLYARDLLQFLGRPEKEFDIRGAMRPAFYVPETRLLRDLLQDFRVKKVHLAIVLDEYGGTAGVVSIEDVLEELVGDISDEHEPHEPSLVRKIDERTAEADAQIRLDELNQSLGLNLPEDAGYETLGGFVSNTLGRIPVSGTNFEQAGLRFTVLDAEPQRVGRVRIEMLDTADESTPPENFKELEDLSSEARG